MQTIGDQIAYPAYVGTGTRLDQAFETIANAVRNNRVAFLFGAGMSKSSKVPQGHALGVKLLKQYFPASGNVTPDEKTFEALAHKYPLEVIAETVHQIQERADRFTEQLKVALLSEIDPELEAHALFQSICFWNWPSVLDSVFTTNFDDLLERAFDKQGLAVTFEHPEHLRNARRGNPPKVPIVHIHGTLAGEYIITESHVYDENDNLLTFEFKSALAQTDAFVLVGYSMSDPDIRAIYMRYRQMIRGQHSQLSEQELNTFVVSPPDDEFDYDLGSKMWHNRGALWIPLDALGFFKKLRYVLEHGAGTKDLADLKVKYRTEYPKDLADKAARIADILCASNEDALQFLFEARLQ